jgi:hypothetical protein
MEYWKERLKNRADWENSMKEAKVRMELYCHLRRRIKRIKTNRRRRRRYSDCNEMSIPQPQCSMTSNSGLNFSYTALKGICTACQVVQEDYSYYGLQESGGM